MKNEIKEFELDWDNISKIGLGNLKKWSEALKKNKRKARGSLKSGNGGRCCLRVAEETFVSREKWGMGKDYFPKTNFWPNSYNSWQMGIANTTSVCCGYSFASLNDGLENDDFIVKCGAKQYLVKAGKGLSHNKIAEVIDYVISKMEKTEEKEND